MENVDGYTRLSGEALQQMAEMSIGKPVVDRRGEPQGDLAEYPAVSNVKVQKPSLLLRRAAWLRFHKQSVEIPAELWENEIIETLLLKSLVEQDHCEWPGEVAIDIKPFEYLGNRRSRFPLYLQDSGWAFRLCPYANKMLLVLRLPVEYRGELSAVADALEAEK